MGPLISDEQFQKVLGYLDAGQNAGAEVVVGGGRAADRGYFVQPTILANTSNDMSVVREEIFGPVVCAIPFDSADEIVPVANDANYGLAAGVFTRDISKAHKTAARLCAGTVWINTYHVFDAAMPFGGYKESGWGPRDESAGAGQLPGDQVGGDGPLDRSWSPWPDVAPAHLAVRLTRIAEEPRINVDRDDPPVRAHATGEPAHHRAGAGAGLHPQLRRSSQLPPKPSLRRAISAGVILGAGASVVQLVQVVGVERVVVGLDSLVVLLLQRLGGLAVSLELAPNLRPHRLGDRRAHARSALTREHTVSTI